ncbi:hypothetical protein [Pelomonas sp. KK5]|uniref:hypothetical protein n=1 Tax=Pelomonas sp. KK5 TaxID=1855730 RepID=UPI00097BF295|nr:hypothetical protein [Pelomonas sp. KK5]
MNAKANALVLLTALANLPASAHPDGGSTALSQISVLPVAISVAGPALLVSGAATLVIVSVTAVADGSVWVLERASDGARFSVTVAGTASAAVGTVCVVSVIATGTLISAAGQAVAFIPNEIGKSLLYNERLTR